MGVFAGVFAGFWIVGILDCAKDKLDYTRDKEVIVTYEPREARPNDFEPAGKVERMLKVLDGGKRG